MIVDNDLGECDHWLHIIIKLKWFYSLRAFFQYDTQKSCSDLRFWIIIIYIRGEFNKFPDFFVQAFKIVLDSWKFSMLLLYIFWDDRPIFMNSGSNEQLHPTKA